MNRRQKKKQFKKKYGMSPAEYEMLKLTPEWQNAVKAMQQAWNSFAEAIQEVGKEITRLWNDLMKNDALAAAIEKETQRIIDGQKTMKMLKNAREMPEGTEEDLLKHIGIRADIYGNQYDFYEDEANGLYFIKFIEEEAQ